MTMNRTKILVIEDEQNIRENVRQLLELNDYEVVEAENGIMGIEAAHREKPDLILCDVMMPQLNGIKTLEAIRSDFMLDTIPFIFLSAKSDIDTIREGMNLGANDFIHKPFSMAELITSVETRLGQVEKMQQKVASRITDALNSIGSVTKHEFNTPLNSIIGLSDLLLRYPATFDEQKKTEMLTAVNESGKRLKNVVRKLSLFQELETYLQYPEQYPLSGSHTGSYQLSEEAQALAKKYGREDDLILQIDPTVFRLHPEDLSFMAYELIDNAFKFSEKGQQVVVYAELEGNESRFGVRDQGIGLPAKVVDDLKPYQQVDRAKMEQQGVGLGLFLTKTICELNKGNFSAQAQEQGTEVVLTFSVF